MEKCGVMSSHIHCLAQAFPHCSRVLTAQNYFSGLFFKFLRHYSFQIKGSLKESVILAFNWQGGW